MSTGQVKWFDAKKGYGFIVGEAGGDVFVHYSSIEGDGFRALRDHDEVEYEVRTTDKGLQASRVRLLRAATGNGPRAQRQAS